MEGPARPHQERGGAGAEPRPLTSWSKILPSQRVMGEGETWGAAGQSRGLERRGEDSSQALGH